MKYSNSRRSSINFYQAVNMYHPIYHTDIESKLETCIIFKHILKAPSSAGEIYRTETHPVEKLPLIRTSKFDKILLQEMLPFFLKLNSILETFVDKSRPGKYCRNVYKSDYHDDVDILTCEDIHVNDTFTACSVDVIFLFHANL